MDVEQMADFKELLTNRLTALQQKQGANIGSLVDPREALPDLADVATEESDRDLTLRMHDHERKMVTQIEAALRRIRAGEYGECIACGDDIGERRLRARPMATHCIDCMTELEGSNRAFGPR